MERRRFIQKIAVVGTVGAATASGAETPGKATVKYKVEGFSCKTCAVGLQVLLRELDGVFTARATYPEGDLTVSFDPGVIGEGAIKAFVAKSGFKVAG